MSGIGDGGGGDIVSVTIGIGVGCDSCWGAMVSGSCGSLRDGGPSSFSMMFGSGFIVGGVVTLAAIWRTYVRVCCSLF